MYNMSTAGIFGVKHWECWLSLLGSFHIRVVAFASSFGRYCRLIVLQGYISCSKENWLYQSPQNYVQSKALLLLDLNLFLLLLLAIFFYMCCLLFRLIWDFPFLKAMKLRLFLCFLGCKSMVGNKLFLSAVSWKEISLICHLMKLQNIVRRIRYKGKLMLCKSLKITWVFFVNEKFMGLIG